MEKNINEEQTSEKDEKETQEENVEQKEEVEETQKPEETPEEKETQEIRDKNRQLYERAKKSETETKELKKELEGLQTKQAESDSDVPDDTTNTQIADLTAQLKEIKDSGERDTVFGKYPILNDKLEEFDEYVLENEGMKLDVAARSFLTENDLLNPPEKRRGLETAGGGTKAPIPSGKMSVDDVKRLRENDDAGYRKAVTEGRIDFED